MLGHKNSKEWHGYQKWHVDNSYNHWLIDYFPLKVVISIIHVTLCQVRLGSRQIDRKALASPSSDGPRQDMVRCPYPSEFWSRLCSSSPYCEAAKKRLKTSLKSYSQKWYDYIHVSYLCCIFSNFYWSNPKTVPSQRRQHPRHHGIHGHRHGCHGHAWHAHGHPIVRRHDGKHRGVAAIGDVGDGVGLGKNNSQPSSYPQKVVVGISLKTTFPIGPT